MKKLQLWTIQWWIIQLVLIWKASGIESIGGKLMVPSVGNTEGKICSKVRQLRSQIPD